MHNLSFVLACEEATAILMERRFAVCCRYQLNFESNYDRNLICTITKCIDLAKSHGEENLRSANYQDVLTYALGLVVAGISYNKITPKIILCALASRDFDFQNNAIHFDVKILGEKNDR